MVAKQIRKHKINTGTRLQELRRVLTTDPEEWKRKEEPRRSENGARGRNASREEEQAQEVTENEAEVLATTISREIIEDDRRGNSGEGEQASEGGETEAQFHAGIDEQSRERQWELGQAMETEDEPMEETREEEAARIIQEMQEMEGDQWEQ
eukprot:gene20329-24347_t